jgi:transposase
MASPLPPSAYTEPKPFANRRSDQMLCTFSFWSAVACHRFRELPARRTRNAAVAARASNFQPRISKLGSFLLLHAHTKARRRTGERRRSSSRSVWA